MIALADTAELVHPGYRGSTWREIGSERLWSISPGLPIYPVRIRLLDRARNAGLQYTGSQISVITGSRSGAISVSSAATICHHWCRS